MIGSWICSEAKPIVVLAVVLVLWTSSSGQSNMFSVNQIDSIITAIDTTKLSSPGISEGEIWNKANPKKRGGYSDSYYRKPKTAQLLKVERTQTLSKNDFTSYYFQDGDLIFVRTAAHRIKNGRKISDGRYYFSKGVLLSKTEKGKPSKAPEVFLQHAKEYLKDSRRMIGL